MSNWSFYVYITTNESRSEDTFAGKYHCFNLVYFEHSKYVNNSIAREKEIKGWLRTKKEELISEFNPEWKFLNDEIMEWPPIDPFHREDLHK